MKTRNILTFIVAAVIFSSCSVSLQERRVADELYQNPDSQPEKEQIYAGYYDEAEKILRDESQKNVDSVIYEKKGYENPYDNILVDDYDEAYQRRINASQSLSYGMSDWYGTYYSDAFWYASAYDPSFYNVIVMGDEVWVEPNWLTSHFGTGWKYGSFYNYPFYGQSYMNPYSTTLTMTGIYGFNSMGYGTYGYNAYGYSPFGYSSFGYSPFGYSSFGYSSFGYSPFGYSSFGYGYGSYYGMSPFSSYYNSSPFQQRLEEQYKLNDEGRLEKYSIHSQRSSHPKKDETSNNTKSYVRVQDHNKLNDTRSIHSVRRTSKRNDNPSTSKYVRTSNNNSYSRPRYKRPEQEANLDRLRRERSSSFSSSDNGRKRSSTYTDHGSTRRSSISSGRSSGSTKSSGSSSRSSSTRSSGSSHSGRGRK